jgi:hypothetical protein
MVAEARGESGEKPGRPARGSPIRSLKHPGRAGRGFGHQARSFDARPPAGLRS